MRKILLSALFISGFLFVFNSCQKDNSYLSNAQKADAASSAASAKKADKDNGASPDKVGIGDCEPTITALIAGQSIPAGSVTVSNDSDYIYVTYTTANGYTLTQTHLFVGDCNAIPVTSNGNPIPGAFPYQATHEHITTYTYTVPLSTIGAGNCGCIASHAVVEKLDASGNVIDRQTAWGNGQRFVPKGNWAMKFPYCTCL